MTPRARKIRAICRATVCNALAILIGAALSASVLASDLRAYFDRKSVYEGDTVTLVIESTSGTLGQPDLTDLDADFDLLGTSRSTSISIVNGQRTDTVRLLVTLAPKRTGTIEVPALKVGGKATQPLSLQVSEIPESGSGSGGDDVFLELDIDLESGEPMVQQQLPLTLRLFTGVPLLQGSLEDPRAAGALITKLGEDRKYSTRRNGREYQVVERHYTLSPERSGELRITPVAFEGSVRSERGRGRGSSVGGPFNDPFFDRFFQGGPLSGDPFGILERGERVSVRSRGITLDVKARPGGYGGEHWLPAESVEIADSWAENPPELQVGEPVTRTLTLRAKGLSGPQIPEIEIPVADGLRVYPEKTESDTRSDGETVYGISTQGVTLIPSRAGELMIPEIRVTWWDTVEQRERVARVPGWTLNAKGGSALGQAPEPPTKSAARLVQSAVPEAQEQSRQPMPETAAAEPGMEGRYLVGGAVLSLLLVTGIAVLRRLRRRKLDAASVTQRLPADPDIARTSGAAARKALRVACEANDARGAAKALLDWADAIWREDAPRNLGALGDRLVCGSDEVRELERRLYAPGSHTWDGGGLWRALQGELLDVRASKQRRSDALEPLYPQRT